MIFRKPYAFIIQHFRKIHLALLLFAIYVFIKTNQVIAFINEFIDTRTYNASLESIDRHLSFFTYLSILLILAMTGVLIYVLAYKKKPWKTYLIPFASYALLFVLFLFTTSYFHGFGDESSFVTARTMSQLVQFVSLSQYAVFLLLIIRILGLDLKKFDFVHDKEYLEIKEEDREEFEVSVEFDKDKIVRFFKRQMREAKYLYQEHPLVFNIIFVVLVVSGVGYLYYYFGVVNKTYQQNDPVQALSYEITVKESYFTASNYKGEVIQSGKDYVAVLLHVKNYGAKRTFNLDRLRLLNKGHAYYYTRLREPSFKDLGATYKKQELAYDEATSFYLVFEVDQNLANDNFVLYYQDIIENKTLQYKKIKLNPVDLHQTKTIAKVKNEEEMELSGIGVEKKAITFLTSSIQESASYSVLSCNLSTCQMGTKTATNQNGKLLVTSYASLDFEGKDFVDFSKDYGKIVYKDSNGKTHTVHVESATEDDYAGKYLYLKVPNELEQATSIQLVYTIRNREYIYQVK